VMRECKACLARECKGQGKPCTPLERCYRAIVTLVVPIESSDEPLPSDEGLEVAYGNANHETDSTSECAIADGLSVELEPV